MSFKTRTTIAKARWIVRVSKKERDGLTRMLVNKAKKGSSPWYAAGIVKHHLALDWTTHLSICLKETHGNSTSMGDAMVNVVCRKCLKRWNKAVKIAKAEMLAEGTITQDELDEQAKTKARKDAREIESRELAKRGEKRRLTPGPGRKNDDHDVATDIAVNSQFFS